MKPRNQKILFYGALLLFCLTAYQFIPFEPTAHDVDIAKQIVGKSTTQPIWAAEIQANGEIVVQTGPLTGTLSGDKYYLRKILGQWRIYKKTPWSLPIVPCGFEKS